MSTGAKVEIYIVTEGGRDCISVRVTDPAANLQDLLEAWQPLCSREDISKAYAPGGKGDCEGCVNNCCNAAFIIPDLIAFKTGARFLGLDEGKYLARCFDSGKMEAGLLRWRSDPCMFLQNLCCGIYPCRALLCRFYLCSPMTGDTEELVYRISWTGAAATLVYAREKGLVPKSAANKRLDSFDNLIRNLLIDYEKRDEIRSFLQAGSYADIPLAPFLDH